MRVNTQQRIAQVSKEQCDSVVEKTLEYIKNLGGSQPYHHTQDSTMIDTYYKMGDFYLNHITDESKFNSEIFSLRKKLEDEVHAPIKLRCDLDDFIKTMGCNYLFSYTVKVLHCFTFEDHHVLVGNIDNDAFGHFVNVLYHFDYQDWSESKMVELGITDSRAVTILTAYLDHSYFKNNGLKRGCGVY